MEGKPLSATNSILPTTTTLLLEDLPPPEVGFCVTTKGVKMEIKAIETVYNGYKFRSRLEARWAVFFDAAGIKYEYEPEGFTDGDLCYLPDFYLPDHNVYVEVKPHREGFEKEVERALHFVNSDLKIKRLMFVDQIPAPNEYESWFLYPFAYYNSLYDDYDMRYVQLCCMDGEISFIPDHYYCKPIYRIDTMGVKQESELNDDMLYEDIDCDDCGNVLPQAYLAARQARFEHGEG